MKPEPSPLKAISELSIEIEPFGSVRAKQPLLVVVEVVVAEATGRRPRSGSPRHFRRPPWRPEMSKPLITTFAPGTPSVMTALPFGGSDGRDDRRLAADRLEGERVANIEEVVGVGAGRHVDRVA